MNTVLTLAAEHGEHVGVLTEYFEVITDPAHIGAELTFIFLETVVIGLILTPLIKRWVKRHDKKYHGVTHETDHSSCNIH